MEDLERILEEHLINDLVALRGTRVGYPTLMTVFAGTELLGSLLSQAERGTDSKHFVHYWTAYLYPERAKREKEADLIYKLFRNGVMHHFFPGGPSGVGRQRPTEHLRIHESGALVIDVEALVDRFIDTYDVSVKPILARTSGFPCRQTMQARLDRIRELGRTKAENLKLKDVFEPVQRTGPAPAVAYSAAISSAGRYDGPTQCL